MRPLTIPLAGAFLVGQLQPLAAIVSSEAASEEAMIFEEPTDLSGADRGS